MTRGDPMGKMFFNILATFAEFEAGLPRICIPEGMATVRAKGKLRGNHPKPSTWQHRADGWHRRFTPLLTSPRCSPSAAGPSTTSSIEPLPQAREG